MGKVTFQLRSLGRHIYEGIKVNIINNEIIQFMCHLIGCIGKNTAYFHDIPTEDAWTECNV